MTDIVQYRSIEGDTTVFDLDSNASDFYAVFNAHQIRRILDRGADAPELQDQKVQYSDAHVLFYSLRHLIGNGPDMLVYHEAPDLDSPTVVFGPTLKLLK